MLIEQLNQVPISKDEDNVPLSSLEVSDSSTKEMEKKKRKRKKESVEEEMSYLEWKPEDCAQPIGKMMKVTGEGGNKKCHYEKFEVHGKKYGLEDSVLLVPDQNTNRKPYVAIIKDIYIQGKEGYVYLKVQWFYRLEDVEKKCVRNLESKDARNLFYSFHCDEVFAESVQHRCLVHFLPENKQIPNRKEHPGFIVKNVYSTVQKKLWKFTDNHYNEQQKHEIGLLVAKTVSRVGDLPAIEKEQQTLKPRPKQSVMKRAVVKAERTNRERSIVVNATSYKSVLEKFDMLTDDSNRNKRLKELLKAVKHKCRLTKKKRDSDYDSFWPNDAVHVVRALEKVFYDSLAENIPKYNHKLEVLVDKLKNSRMLAERLLIGELKPEQILLMKRYELTRGHTFDEITAVIEEPILKIDYPSIHLQKC